MDDTFLALTNIIQEYDYFIIMSHANVDLDGLSSALCMSSIIDYFHKKNSLFFYNNSKNTSINKAIDRLKEADYPLNFITDIKGINSDKTLLIILDTHRQILLEDQNLLSSVTNVVIIDHHIKMPDYIKKTLLSYINVNASSVVEIMTMYLKYLNLKVKPILATIMLAGLEIDTNSYTVKTTEKTYISAYLLSKMGADNIIKQELMQENKDTVLKRVELLKNSYLYNNKYSICVIENQTIGREELAMLSELQLRFEHVQASFTIGMIDAQTIGISARSLGYVNVEKVMKLMGGGGHVTDAAAQIVNEDLLVVVKELEKILS